MMFLTKNKSLLIIVLIMLAMINITVSKWKYTKKQSYQGGNIWALTSHNLVCPNKYALTYFTALKSGNNFWFRYKCYGACAGLRKMKKTYNAQTGLNATDGNKKRSLHYLDRHNVQCKNGFSLQSFRLVKSGNKIQYKYKCTETKCSSRPSYKSKTANMGANETKNYPKLIIKTPKFHQVITGFKFQRTKGNSFHYQVRYCKLNHKFNKKKPTSKKPSGKKPTPSISALPPAKDDDVPTVAPLSPAADLAIKNGNKFCAKNCVTNLANRTKQCILGQNKKPQDCKRCTINPKIKNPSKKIICESLCNGILPSKPCSFFGYLNGKKKNIPGSILKKFGLQLIRRRR